MVDLKNIHKAIVALLDGCTGRIEDDFAIIENPDDDGNPLRGEDPFIVVDLAELLNQAVGNKVLEHKEETYQGDEWDVYSDGNYPYDPD